MGFDNAYLRAVRGRLRNELAITSTVETPPMIDALQPPPLINPPLGEGRKAVWALVVEHLPFPLHLVPPNNNFKTQHRFRMWDPLIQITDGRDGVPIREPVEFLLRFLDFKLWGSWVCGNG